MQRIRSCSTFSTEDFGFRRMPCRFDLTELDFKECGQDVLFRGEIVNEGSLADIGGFCDVSGDCFEKPRFAKSPIAVRNSFSWALSSISWGYGRSKLRRAEGSCLPTRCGANVVM